MSRMHNASVQTMLVIEPDGVVRSTVAAVVRELDLAQVHQAASVHMGTQVLMNTAFNLFPDSAAAKGQKANSEEPASSEQVAFATLMRGVHW